MRDAGDIGAVGVGTNRADVAHHLLDRVGLDAVLLAGRITLLDATGELVAERCASDHVRLLAAGVFQSGILAGGAGTTVDYLPASATVRDLVNELAAVCRGHGISLHAAAINHPRRFPGVSSTLVGVRSPTEVAAAVEAITTELPPALWHDLDEVRSRWPSLDQGAS